MPYRFYTFLLLLVVLSASLTAQVRYGRVTYTCSVTSRIIDAEEEKTLPGGLGEQIAKMQAAGAFDQTFTLTFAPQAYLFEQEAAEDVTLENGDRTIIIERSGNDPEQWYTDLERHTYTNSQLIADRQFLVSGKLPELAWTITDELTPPNEATGGFELQTATTVTSRGDSLVAGFTKAIPYPFGPENYGGLPGAILRLTVYTEREVTNYLIQSIEILPTPPDLPLPVKGKVVTETEFVRLQQKIAARKR